MTGIEPARGGFTIHYLDPLGHICPYLHRRCYGVCQLLLDIFAKFRRKNADIHFLFQASLLGENLVKINSAIYLSVKGMIDDVLNLDKSVRTLDLTHNKIVDIPMEISKLINIQRLVLDDNHIERLPVNLGKLQSLKVMTLDGNRITSLPDELGQLVRLERLSILGNMLTCLPETIGSLRNLVLLNVSNNKLKSLPESIGSCYSLEELQANDNLIGELPASICNLIHLKSLCLNNNNIGQIPANLLKDCKALQNISLHNNPISMDQFQQMEGFEEFEARRRKKFDKQIDSNVMISSKGLNEGVDK
ncbi:Leucine-rich repeat (LRR) family protein [Citrus sinensis]|uniref:Leucine-rich repeat (LRR) family protein n=2 Tax=Citrus sinensis TaxID=2711 RepID=A0ACB8LXE0_CITSI|nr:Leucine-rich repeat (LRR) family protein [Citrus sinensis]